MFKKITFIVLLVGLSGFLVWGGINRTLAKTTEVNARSTEPIDRVARGKNAETHLNANQVSCEESLKGIEDQDGSGTSGHPAGDNSENQGRGNGGGKGGSNGVGQGGSYGGSQGNGSNPLDEVEIESLHLALDDEYHALAVYQKVIDDFGDVAPFVEIAHSENRHIESLLKQFEKHGLTPPDNTWLGNVPGFDNLQAACRAGAEAELANVALYNQLLSMIDNPGLTQVFTNLSHASQDSHLPEFQACQ